MKTLIRKRYKSGFFLSEPDLRRLYQIMVDAAIKLSPEKFESSFYVRLENGTILELSTIDEVLALDNTEQRSIEFLYVAVGQSKKHAPDEEYEDHTDWALSVRFEKVAEYWAPQPSILVDVRGTSRDWVVLAAGELDERVRSISRIAWPRVLARPHLPLLILLTCFLAIAIGLLTIPRPLPVYSQLETLYQAGKITNPVEALLILEKARASRAPVDFILVYAFGFVATFAALALSIPRIARIASTPYVFYWGDYSAVYQRRRGFAFIVWTVVVLGIVVGVASSYVSKRLGI